MPHTNRKVADALRTLIEHERREVEAMEKQAVQMANAIEVRAANVVVLDDQLRAVEKRGTR